MAASPGGDTRSSLEGLEVGAGLLVGERALPEIVVPAGAALPGGANPHSLEV